MDLADRAAAEFTAEFGGEAAALARAPGRVELLGNHTDYNGGLVMSAAIDRYTVVAARPRGDRRARVLSVDLGERDEFDVDGASGVGAGWARYVRGVVWAVQERFGRLRSGFEAVIVGDVPQGAGLSSSASLEAAVAWALIGAGLAEAADDDATRMAMARALQRAENECAGVACGLLDQFSSVFGAADHALTLDCATGGWDRVPLKAASGTAPAIVVCDSRTSRRLADGMYNRRRAECETVVAHFQRVKGGGARWLRDVSLGELERDWEGLDPVGRRRARHVLTENARVEAGAAALRAGDLAGFGRLMTASHESSRDDFENSGEALDRLIEAARESPGFLGGKLSGAGWAGATVNLVEGEVSAAFVEAVRAGVERRGGVEPLIHVCRAAAGAGVLGSAK